MMRAGVSGAARSRPLGVLLAPPRATDSLTTDASW